MSARDIIEAEFTPQMCADLDQWSRRFSKATTDHLFVYLDAIPFLLTFRNAAMRALRINRPTGRVYGKLLREFLATRAGSLTMPEAGDLMWLGSPPPARSVGWLDDEATPLDLLRKLLAARDGGSRRKISIPRTARNLVERTVRERIAPKPGVKPTPAAGPAAPPPLSESAKARLAREIEKHKQLLDYEFGLRVAAEVKKQLPERMTKLHDEMATMKAVIERRKGHISKAEFNTLRRALHPDTGEHVGDADRNAATMLLESLQVVLVGESDYKTSSLPSLAEMMAAGLRKQHENSERSKAVWAKRKAAQG